ncbi:MAG: hypothetical protein M1825_002312 [Sarcosagium campestre]|nr:MAG: hypothetical protein M1825_002312 [Sarcosagium campestre]
MVGHLIVPEAQDDSGRSPPSAATSKRVEHLSAKVLSYVKTIHRDLAGAQASLDHQQTLDFLTKVQGVGAEQSASIIPKSGHFGFDDFIHYVTSVEFDASGFPKIHDLSYPLTNYFISSSHNTYLTGNQLYGQSTTDGYKNVLLRGCRCIEIDVWDGEPRSPTDDSAPSANTETRKRSTLRIPTSISPKRRQSDAKAEVVLPNPSAAELGVPTPWISSSTAARAEPRVLHGLISPYHNVNKAKKRQFRIHVDKGSIVPGTCLSNSDSSSDLPIIVSLEVHASYEQQEVMVEIMKEAWRDLLVDDSKYVEHSVLPSPGSLKRKILVKVKRATASKEIAKTTEAKPESKNTTRDRSLSRSSDSGDDEPVVKDKKKKSKVLEALGNLGIYTRSYHFSSFSQPEASIPSHVFSLSEKTVMDVHESNGEELFAHNLNYFMRAYPSGLRVSSSNLDPSVFWRKGIQMVALNWQKWDEGIMLNEGMFSGEGGWVLKPRGYRSDDHKDSGGQANAIGHKTLDFCLEIFAAQDLPLPIGDDNPGGFHPYVKCELHVEKPEERTGAPIEGGGKNKDGQYKRKSATRKGINPDFKKQKLEFLGIPGVVQELSFLRVKIHDDEIGKDDLSAWVCIRLDRVQNGYRFLHLLDARGAQSGGVLLVKITKQLR